MQRRPADLQRHTWRIDVNFTVGPIAAHELLDNFLPLSLHRDSNPFRFQLHAYHQHCHYERTNYSIAAKPKPMKTTADASNLYHTLLNRFRDLEVSHRRLQEQFEALLQEKEEEETRRRREVEDARGMERSLIPAFFAKGVYWSVLQSMGHAVHVSRADTGQIIYW